MATTSRSKWVSSSVWLFKLAAALAVSIGPQAEKPAQAQQQGFQGESPRANGGRRVVILVDHPWYSSMRYFAAGITLNYAHNPLVFGRVSSSGVFSQTTAVIEHQLIGHVDPPARSLTACCSRRLCPSPSWKGDPNGAGGVKANDNISFGDPRVGVMIRLFGQPYRSAISMSIGGLSGSRCAASSAATPACCHRRVAIR